MLFDDAIGLGNLILAGVAVLRDDFAEVVHVVDIDVVQLSHSSVDIPRQPKIHHK